MGDTWWAGRGCPVSHRDVLVVGVGPDMGHKAHYDNMMEGWVPEMLGYSHPSANKDVTTARKIEYKNLVQEIEAAHANIPWPRVFTAFLFSKTSLCFVFWKKPLC